MGFNYPEEPTRIQSPDVLPPIEELQPKSLTHTPAVNDTAASTGTEGGSGESVQEEGSSVIFTIGKLNDFLQWFLMVLEITLLVRFIFKLIGVDASNGFANFLYALTDIILYPFNNIVHASMIGTTQRFEWHTLIGMAIYALILYAVRRFLHIIISDPAEPPN